MRAVRDGLIVAGWLSGLFLFAVVVPFGRSLGYDAFSYWSIQLDDVYGRTFDGNYTLGAFRYTPPIALVFAPFAALPWWLFLWLYSAAMVGALAWLGGRWTLGLLALPPVAFELYHGNIHLLLAVAVAVGLRYPAAWAFVLLAKVTPGVALVWFAVRREWRGLGIALAATTVAVVLSAILAPGLWEQWAAATISNLDEPQPYSIPPPLFVRLPLAVALVAWGARTDRPWTVPVGAALALPIIWVHGVVVALGAVPFLRRRAGSARGAGALLAPDPDRGWPDAIRIRDLAAYVGSAVAVAAGAAIVAEGPIRALLTAASSALIPFFP